MGDVTATVAKHSLNLSSRSANTNVSKDAGYHEKRRVDARYGSAAPFRSAPPRQATYGTRFNKVNPSHCLTDRLKGPLQLEHYIAPDEGPEPLHYTHHSS
ncbi:hypothetical protein E2C01_009705 [Portunus trituberculatus]|uniref:Uncharacterized protein n=1 Tax=Portunus trituberculatus TaxID=210409 RepID=A0A5B7D6Q1_PORTR|nr:hypothetical protein [Portunus trituberculatus]